MQIEKELFVTQYFVTPRSPVEGLQLVKFLFRKVEPFPLNIFIMRHPPDRSLFGERTAMRAIDDPFQYAHILAEAWPQEISLSILAEPVHVKNTRRLGK